MFCFSANKIIIFRFWSVPVAIFQKLFKSLTFARQKLIRMLNSYCKCSDLLVYGNIDWIIGWLRIWLIYVWWITGDWLQYHRQWDVRPAAVPEILRLLHPVVLQTVRHLQPSHHCLQRCVHSHGGMNGIFSRLDICIRSAVWKPVPSCSSGGLWITVPRF